MSDPFVTFSAWERKEIVGILKEAADVAEEQARSGDELFLRRAARLIEEAHTVCCYGVADE